MSARPPWYRSRWKLLAACVVGGYLALLGVRFLHEAYVASLPRVDPEFAAAVRRPLFGEPTLEVAVWHDHPAPLEDVLLFVHVNERPGAEGGWDKRSRRFGSWPPGRDNGVTFLFPLKRDGSGEAVRVGVGLLGPRVRPSIVSADWLGDTWRRDPE